MIISNIIIIHINQEKMKNYFYFIFDRTIKKNHNTYKKNFFLMFLKNYICYDSGNLVYFSKKIFLT